MHRPNFVFLVEVLPTTITHPKPTRRCRVGGQDGGIGIKTRAEQNNKKNPKSKAKEKATKKQCHITKACMLSVKTHAAMLYSLKQQKNNNKQEYLSSCVVLLPFLDCSQQKKYGQRKKNATEGREKKNKTTKERISAHNHTQQKAERLTGKGERARGYCSHSCGSTSLTRCFNLSCVPTHPTLPSSSENALCLLENPDNLPSPPFPQIILPQALTRSASQAPPPVSLPSPRVPVPALDIYTSPFPPYLSHKKNCTRTSAVYSGRLSRRERRTAPIIVNAI